MTDRYNVPALQRGLQILGLFTRESKEFTGAELAAKLKLPRASVFRILQTLEASGFVEKIADTTRFRLGVSVLRLGFEYISSLEITEFGRFILDSLTDDTGYSSHLVVRDQREAVLVAKAVGISKAPNSIQVGARLPAHATVLGRALLSGLNEDQLQALYSNLQLQRYSATTPVTIDELDLRIKGIRKIGYEISLSGFEPGISTIAAPVVMPKSTLPYEVPAAVGITVPANTIPDEKLMALVHRVQYAASKLGERLVTARMPAIKAAA